MTNKLLVIPADKISDWIEKGEVLPRYHNPGEIFDEIHFVLPHDENPDPKALQSMAGRAKVFVHPHVTPPSYFKKTLGWQPFFTWAWEKSALPLISKIKPDVIRCYGAHLNLILAKRIKQRFNIPYAVSLHINPEVNIRRISDSPRNIIFNYMTDRLEKRGLKEADIVLPVYKSIIPYLDKRNIERYEVCYNMVQHDPQNIKKDYTLHNPIKIICAGRQFRDKDPSNLMRAVASRNDTQLTLVGKGEFHNDLKALAREIGRPEQFIFLDAISNEELCRQLPGFDLMALHSEYYEFSKVMIEAMLSGLPLMINFRQTGPQIPELNDDICYRIDSSVEGYKQGLNKILGDTGFREKLGQNAMRLALKNWSLETTEEKYKQIYLSLLGKSKNV